jgi:hypothetical protein
MQLPSSYDAAQQLILLEEMVMDHLADFFLVNIREQVVREWDFRVCKLLRRGFGKSVELGIPFLVSSIEA